MFEIDEDSLPFVRTRQALLILDLQNDLVSPGGILAITNPPGFLERIVKILPHFRSSGNVIHFRSVFEASREVNESHGDCESVITNKELSMAPGRRSKHQKSIQKLSHSLYDDQDSVNETFLTVKPGQEQSIVLPNTLGSSFADIVAAGIDDTKDLIFQKTWYSAFKDGTLVQTLRSRFVTEIYICGALTNISVFATALDAARHGYAITIVDDCLGYGNKKRHDEALRQMEEFTGCDTISSDELIQELRRKATRQKPPTKSQSTTRPSEKALPGLESLMADLQLRTSAPRLQVNPSGLSADSVALTEASGSVISESSKESPEVRVPPEPAKIDNTQKDRIRSKIKSRQRDGRLKEEQGKLPSTSKIPSSKSAPFLSKVDNNQLPKEEEIRVTQYLLSAKESDISNQPKLIMPETIDTELSKGIEAMTLEAKPVISSEIETQINSELNFICAGDTTVINDLLDNQLADGIFEKIRDEVQWQKMSHQGGDVPRLVAVQGEVGDDGSIPIYRHPADESPQLLPFSPSVQLIRAQAEKKLAHQVNHVLIQYYRDGTDYISEHSDKTLDIVPGTFIANVSLGAQRTMVFRTKKPIKDKNVNNSATLPRNTCRAPLPHNSMCKMGLITNERWLHGIRQDKRLLKEKTAEELAYDGGRISLTFRKIGTFLDKDQKRIWGQGAVSKAKESANTVINGNTREAEEMIRAFGQENHSSEFDWAAHYGKGFDVLHISSIAEVEKPSATT